MERKAMSITYSDYDTQSQIITIKLDTGGQLLIFMDDITLAYYGPGLDIELPFKADAAKDIIFLINGLHYTALQVVQWCVNNHESIHNNEAKEAEDNEAMIAELSCPKASGRI